MMIIIIVTILLVSFILAFRALKELEVPEEAKKTIKSIRPKVSISGFFLFLKGKVLHFQSEPSPTPSSDNDSP